MTAIFTELADAFGDEILDELDATDADTLAELQSVIGPFDI